MTNQLKLFFKKHQLHFKITIEKFQLFLRSTGKIIMDILPPISTVELSLKDIDVLMAKTYSSISQRYDELGEEIRRKIS